MNRCSMLAAVRGCTGIVFICDTFCSSGQSRAQNSAPKERSIKYVFTQKGGSNGASYPGQRNGNYYTGAGQLDLAQGVLQSLDHLSCHPGNPTASITEYPYLG